jgi:hypothetical protein
MLITVERITSTLEETLGILFLDGKFECFTLEDQYQTEKVYGETRIPEGIYEVTLRTFGGFHKRYQRKFDFHRGMLWIKHVDNFKDILFHIGNDDDDTAGCILVGTYPVEKDLRWNVSISTGAYKDFYEKVLAAFDRGEKVEVHVVNRDKPI